MTASEENLRTVANLGLRPRRTAVIVSPHFPPSTLASVHRARHLAKHLPAAGWEPIIVCVDAAFHEERPDPALARLVPERVEQVSTSALPSRLMRPLGVGDIGLRGYRPLRRAVLDLAKRRHADIVLITGAPYYPMMIAGALKARGIPVVLDFQDPWVSRWGAAQPLLSKAGLSHRLATWLEPRALRAASFVTSVSEIQNDELAQRYPWFDAARMAAIPIGGDPDDFDALRRDDVRPSNELLAADRINISFVGTYAERFAPVMRALFGGVRRLRETEPSLANHIRLNFIGNSGRTDGVRAFRVRPLAEAAGVADMVHEAPQRLPFLDALSVMAHSAGLLLVGSDEPHYTASRIYPALMSGRPYLSLYHAASSAHAVLRSAGGGIAFSFADEDELRRIEPGIAAGLRRLALDPSALGSADPTVYADTTASAVAQRFAEVFERMTRTHSQRITAGRG